MNLDPDLLGVGARSVFTLEQFVMLFGCCAVIAFTEYLIMYLRILRQICSGEGLPNPKKDEDEESILYQEELPAKMSKR